MRIYVDIHCEQWPSGKNFYLYSCEEINAGFTPSYPQYSDYFNLPLDDDGTKYYQTDITIDINEIDPNYKLFFLNTLTKELNNKFSTKIATESALTELAKQIKQQLLPKLHDAYTKGAMQGLFVKIGLPSEIGFYAGKFLTKKDAEEISLSTKLALDTANAAKQDEENRMNYRPV